MNLEEQVVSLDLAKRLKELGVKQESLGWWYQDQIDVGESVYRLAITADNKGLYLAGSFIGTIKPNVDYSAFTVAELGEMLFKVPKGSVTFYNYQDRDTTIHCSKFGIYPISQSPEKESVGTANTEANSRAELLIYLLENKLISSEA